MLWGVARLRKYPHWPPVCCHKWAATANQLIDVTKWHYAINLPSNLFHPPMELLSQLWGRTFISSPLQIDHILKFNCFGTLAVRTLCILKTNYSWCTAWLWCLPTSDWLGSTQITAIIQSIKCYYLHKKKKHPPFIWSKRKPKTFQHQSQKHFIYPKENSVKFHSLK